MIRHDPLDGIRRNIDHALQIDRQYKQVMRFAGMASPLTVANEEIANKVTGAIVLLESTFRRTSHQGLTRQMSPGEQVAGALALGYFWNGENWIKYPED